MNVGVVIGRFQIDQLHAGHLEFLENVDLVSDEVLILLGVAPVPYSKQNPLDYNTRRCMIEQYFEAGQSYQVHPIADCQSDQEWSDNVDKLISILYPNHNITLYGSRDSFLPYYKGKYKTQFISCNDTESATKRRHELKTYEIDSFLERAALIKGIMNQYDKVNATVDVAILNGKDILLGRKKNEPNFRFIGGFADPKDKSFKEAGKREVYEETGLTVSDFVYIDSFQMDDWRYHKLSDKIITTFFKANVEGSSFAKANDDIVEVKWFHLNDFANNVQVMPVHQILKDALIDHLRKTGDVK